MVQKQLERGDEVVKLAVIQRFLDPPCPHQLALKDEEDANRLYPTDGGVTIAPLLPPPVGPRPKTSSRARPPGNEQYDRQNFAANRRKCAPAVPLHSRFVLCAKVRGRLFPHGLCHCVRWTCRV